MNALIIAQHHGSFFTMHSAIGKFDRVVVFLPQTQIDKYSTYPEPAFKDYQKSVTAYCKKHKFELYITNFDDKASPSHQYSAAVKDLGGTGLWVVLSAGSIYQEHPETSKLQENWFSMTRGRVFELNDRLSMYGMIGHAPIDSTLNEQNFFMNLDLIQLDGIAPLTKAMRDGKVHFQRHYQFGRPSALVGCALSAVECIRLRTKSKKSPILNYWMRAINRDVLELELLTYPFDEYARIAKSIKKYLPLGAFSVISENGARSKEYRELADLDL